MSKKKKKVDNSDKLFIYAWGVAFLTGAFFVIYTKYFNGRSKWLFITGAIILMIAFSLIPLAILIGGLKDGYFRYGSQNTFIKFIKKDEAPLRYYFCVSGEVLSFIAVYVVGIILITKFLL